MRKGRQLTPSEVKRLVKGLKATLAFIRENIAPDVIATRADPWLAESKCCPEPEAKYKQEPLRDRPRIAVGMGLSEEKLRG